MQAMNKKMQKFIEKFLTSIPFRSFHVNLHRAVGSKSFINLPN